MGVLRRTIPAVLFCMLPVMLASCGGDDGPDRADFIARADAVCRQARSEMENLDVDAAARAARQALTELRALELPSEGRPRIRAFLRDFGEQVEALTGAGAAPEDAAKLVADARSIGFSECAREISDITRRQEEGRIPINELEVARCFVEGNEASDRVEVVPCDIAHDGEVFATTDMAAAPDAAFPGEDPIKDFADRFCSGQFQRYVGKALNDSTLTGFFFRPTDATWAEGDRTVVCVVIEKDESPRTGSAKGSGL
jgi:hypothetical protein